MSKHAPLDTSSLVGSTIGGKYRVESVLGTGAMGVVVAAHHLDLDERVALKFLAKKRDGEGLHRFVREARAAFKIRSENVARVLDIGRGESGDPFIVMEHLEGASLRDVLAVNGGKLGVVPAIDLLHQAALGVAEAHGLDIVHRDLKPENLFVTHRSDGSPLLKVLDFGVAKFLSQEGFTETDVTVGTPLYMAPEQFSSANVDARSDVWSLGVILYKVTTGQLPYEENSISKQLARIKKEKPRPPRSLEPQISPELDHLITRCLEFDRDKRFANARELSDALGVLAFEPRRPSELRPFEVEVPSEKTIRRAFQSDSVPDLEDPHGELPTRAIDPFVAQGAGAKGGTLALDAAPPRASSPSAPAVGSQDLRRDGTLPRYGRRPNLAIWVGVAVALVTLPVFVLLARRAFEEPLPPSPSAVPSESAPAATGKPSPPASVPAAPTSWDSPVPPKPSR